MKKIEKFESEYDIDKLYHIDNNEFIHIDNEEIDGELFKIVNKADKTDFKLIQIPSCGVDSSIYSIYNELNLISTTPNPNYLCIVNENVAYFIDCLFPKKSFKVADYPIKKIIQSLKFGLLLICTNEKILAYNKNIEVELWCVFLSNLIDIDDGYTIIEKEDYIEIIYFNFKIMKNSNIIINLDKGNVSPPPR